jgi:hypothetical protein
MRDRTAMTEPLTTGQSLVARWEGTDSGWSEPADLAEAIDEAIAEAVLAERERCCQIVWGHCGSDNVGQRTVDAIRKKSRL